MRRSKDRPLHQRQKNRSKDRSLRSDKSLRPVVPRQHSETAEYSATLLDDGTLQIAASAATRAKGTFFFGNASEAGRPLERLFRGMRS